jgi:hypothetical protein
MNEKELVDKIKELLKTDADLNFLLELKKEELENRLVVLETGYYKLQLNQSP